MFLNIKYKYIRAWGTWVTDTTIPRTPVIWTGSLKDSKRCLRFVGNCYDCDIKALPHSLALYVVENPFIMRVTVESTIICVKTKIVTNQPTIH